MCKKILLILLTLVFCFNQYGCNGFIYNSKNTEEVGSIFEPESYKATDESSENDIMRGVWLSCYEIERIVKNNDEHSYKLRVKEILENIKASGLDTVIFQVRGFSDALYTSEIFPSSRFIVESEGDELLYDPFEIFLKEANEKGIFVHAWINPFRVSYSSDLTKLSKENPAYKIYEKNSDTTALLISSEGVFYNPASTEATSIILNGVKELLLNYEITGVQFDDYFYPAEATINDDKLYKEYKSKGGELSKTEWRKGNISNFISSVYALVKGYDESLVFGVSPSADFEYNERVFADVKEWCSEEGYIDYIMPQLYFGFENENKPFCEVADEWAEVDRCKGVSLYSGFSAYKCGEVDENALSGKNEWVENSDILKKQYEYIKSIGEYTGFALFSYSYCFGENINENSNKELRYLTSML